MDAIFGATGWVAAAAMAITTVHLLWTSLAERLLSLRETGIVVLVSAAFAAAWLTVLAAAGVPLSTMPARDAVGVLSLVLLPLVASLLAPWSLSRIRHT